LAALRPEYLKPPARHDRSTHLSGFDALDVLRKVSKRHAATPAQTALAYQLHHPDITAPIVGARTVDRLEGHLRVADLAPSEAEFERLETAEPGPFEELP
jgi:aryl-alcohol dehydrogenase-like predicted oxidoreductase